MITPGEILGALAMFPRAEQKKIFNALRKMLEDARTPECRRAFDWWWDALPGKMKQSKALAWSHWKHIWHYWPHATSDMRLVLSGALSIQLENDHFVLDGGKDNKPHGSTWLSRERWKDHVERKQHRGPAGTATGKPREDQNRALSEDERAKLRGGR